MPRQIIKKDNGKYAIWSTIVDDFIFDDITIEEYIAFRREEDANDAEKTIRKIVGEMESGKKPYGQFTKTYEEACEWRDEVHKDENVNEEEEYE